MKQGILYWIGLVLAYEALDGIVIIAMGVQRAIESGDNISHFPFYLVTIIVASIAAILGLARRVAWARVLAFVVLITSVLGSISITAYFVLSGYSGADISKEPWWPGMWVSSLIFNTLYLFLAYKLYTSTALKTYLSQRPG